MYRGPCWIQWHSQSRRLKFRCITGLAKIQVWGTSWTRWSRLRHGPIAKKAEPFPIMLALSLEDMVVCERDCLYTRWYAWVKLLKLWAAFRWDDLQGIHASDLHLRSDGVLEGKIRRSKTSGVGKKVEVMVFFIGTDAWIFQEIWLVTGWKIHRQLSEGSGLADRDYLVPKPTPCLNGFRKAMVKYGDALVMTRALLLELRVDIKVGSESARSEEPLLVTSHATAFWSEHSERGTIDTWMQMAGVAPDVRRMVGRWSASQEEGYLRHVEAAVKEAQKACCLEDLRDSLRSLKIRSSRVCRNSCWIAEGLWRRWSANWIGWPCQQLGGAKRSKRVK